MEVRLSSVLHCCCKSLAAPVALSEKYCASVDACNISVWCLPLERETRRKVNHLVAMEINSLLVRIFVLVTCFNRAQLSRVVSSVWR